MRESKLNHNCIIVDISSSFSYYFSHPLYSTALCNSLKAKYGPFTQTHAVHTHTHARTHTQMGADRQSMWSQGVTDTWHWWTHWVAYHSACLCAVIDSCTSFLTFSRTHAHTLWAPTVSGVMLLSSVMQGWHTLCLMLMSNSLSNDCVCVLRKKEICF